jgi:hypothetical protein
MSLDAPPSYTFAVVNERNESFPVTFAVADQRAKECFQSVWKRMSGAVEEFHKAEAKLDPTGASPTPDWVKWSPWDWCLSSKSDVAAREMVIGWCGSRMVGFLSLWPAFPSQAASGLQTLYVEHIGAFPGNLETAIWGRRYRQVGGALFAYAVFVSIDKGFDGRWGLHASNADALAFYRGIEKKLTTPLFHPERQGVLGPTPQATRHDANRTYLETTEAGAKEWLEGYRDA